MTFSYWMQNIDGTRELRKFYVLCPRIKGGGDPAPLRGRGRESSGQRPGGWVSRELCPLARAGCTRRQALSITALKKLKNRASGGGGARVWSRAPEGGSRLWWLQLPPHTDPWRQQRGLPHPGDLGVEFPARGSARPDPGRCGRPGSEPGGSRSVSAPPVSAFRKPRCVGPRGSLCCPQSAVARCAQTRAAHVCGHALLPVFQVPLAPGGGWASPHQETACL